MSTVHVRVLVGILVGVVGVCLSGGGPSSSPSDEYQIYQLVLDPLLGEPDPKCSGAVASTTLAIDGGIYSECQFLLLDMPQEFEEAIESLAARMRVETELGEMLGETYELVNVSSGIIRSIPCGPVVHFVTDIGFDSNRATAAVATWTVGPSSCEWSRMLRVMTFRKTVDGWVGVRMRATGGFGWPAPSVSTGRAKDTRLSEARALGHAYMDLMDSGEVDAALAMLNPRLEELGELEKMRDSLKATMANLGRRLGRRHIGSQAFIDYDTDLAGAHVQLEFEVMSEKANTIELVQVSVLECDDATGILGHMIEYVE